MALDEKQAAKRVAELRREIEEHNRRYYEEAAPTISDREYDALYRELSDLEKRFPETGCGRFPHPENRRQSAEGVRPDYASGPDAQPRQHLLGRRGDRFLSSARTPFAEQKIPVVIEPKVDGVAVSLLYEKGELRYAATAATARSATTSPKTSGRSARCRSG